MTEQELIQVFKERGALLDGHFRLTSGLHSNRYIQCAQVLKYPDLSAELGKQLADHFRDLKVDTVVGPAVGGIIVAQEVGRALGVKAIFSERVEGEMTLRCGFEISEGERVVVVEDVVTTGGSTKEVIELVKEHGGVVVGGRILSRSPQWRAGFWRTLPPTAQTHYRNIPSRRLPIMPGGLAGSEAREQEIVVVSR